MQNKIISVVIGVIVVIGAAFLVISSSHSSTNTNASPSPSPSITDTSTPSPTITTTPSPTITAKTYTLAQVATHKDATSCWSAVNGNVYDLTSWVNQHPGGPDAILSICGKDGSTAFNGQHGADSRAQSMLATFKIGVLVH